ncbi:uncharacterized protein F4822DRAFT_433493 [Hypoxylon trugodes]|uniref:uncharacterized protein n=1 Tax=Hypoxylon trugodes TaxID=326681 RepID=UPI0021A1D4A9|nr:uncharacterized protein F4822DRAFT_433493 [Hypoxylon trugodes]KAI1384957.1 hypothetical protein F4822DRAFT_433493 [Hypoxylon trugodes]
MHVSAIFLTGLAAVALAAPLDASTQLAERQYDPIEKVHASLEGGESDATKRQYEPIEKVHASLEGKESKRQYEPIEKVHASLEGKESQ